MKEIVMIPIGELYHHPENPRKDLGDISELTESIRKNGIMQNLTVVKGHQMTKAEFVAEARAEGADKAYLQVSLGNDGAVALYEKLGLLEHHRHRYIKVNPGNL